MRPVAVLRPEPGASATVRSALEIGLDAFSVPLFTVEPKAWIAPDPAAFDGLLLTSANAIRHAGPQLRQCTSLPVHAVGAATADAARSAGLAVLTVGEGGVDALVRSLPAGLRLLHLCGEHRRGPSDVPQEIASIPVYRAVQIEIPKGLERLTGAVAMIHSPRAGRRLAELLPDRSRTTVAAISPAAAEASGAGWARLAAAEHPNDEALLSLASQLCKEPLPE